MVKYVYNLALPETAATNESDSLGQQLAQAGILDEDGAVVESISSKAADLTLEGQYRWGATISSMLATELDELADSALSELPLFRRADDERYANRGYYEIESADVAPLHANNRSVWTYTLNLTYVGKRSSHFRAIAPNPKQVDHDWGTGTTSEVGISAAAGKVRWFNSDTGNVALATSVRTEVGQNSDVDVFDLSDGEAAVGTSAPLLVYDVAYPDDVQTGVRTYDTEGHADKFRALDDGSDGPRQWQTIHTTEHDIEDPVVMSNGLLRLRLDESASELTAEAWDDVNTQWTSTLASGDQPATVSLFDVNVTEIGMVRDRAQLTFDVDGTLFALDATLPTGDTDVLFSIPDGESGPVPTDLEDWLAPIASTSIVDENEAKTLVSRSEVAR